MKRVVTMVIAILAMAAAISADVTITRQVTFEMAGMPPNEMRSTESIQGAKSCNTTEFTGGGMMAMAGEQSAQVNITRLDKGVIWNLSEGTKTYNEIDLNSYKDMMGAQSAPSKASDEADVYEWTYEVKKEDRETENGFKCKAIIAVADGVNKEDPSDKVALNYEFWMSEDLPGMDEMDEYYEQYTGAMGIDPYNQEQMIDKMAADYGAQLKKMAENFRDLKGHPVKTVISVKKSGAVGIPGMPEGTEMDPRAAEMMKKMMGGKAPAQSEDGMSTVFSMVTEIVDIKTDKTDASAFEIPEGYTKR